ncbi:M23 family metallopeptidase [Humidisolicoccus flavus]|uniref:M23 family metallopeptidase n=1 Tax=Humidisolicoccus flavus TaxID=3111414 RepID=UPI00324E8BFC
MTRKQLRELQARRAAESGDSVPSATDQATAPGAPAAVAPSAVPAAQAAPSVPVVSSGPLFESRRAIRLAATKAAAELPVTLSADLAPGTDSIVMPAPAVAAADGKNRAARRANARAIVARRARETSVSTHAPRSTGPSKVRVALQRLSAASALLFVGSMVVVTSLPAQAMQTPEQAAEVINTQDLQSVSVADSATASVASTESFEILAPEFAAALSPEEMARLQTIANSQTAGSTSNGTSAFPKVWAELETSYTQSPFPQLETVRTTSPFGARPGGFHGGVDFAPGLGTEIHPIANGVVSKVFQGNNLGGYVVWVDHNIDGEFFQSWYAHMIPGSINVEVGEVVDINSVVGLVGSSGKSTGPHLHLEIKNDNWVSFDPVRWLATRQQVLEP